MRPDPRDHVAHVVEPLTEVILLDAGELGGVGLHHQLEGRERRQVLLFDDPVNPGEQLGIVENLQMGLEDLGRGRAQLLIDPLDQALQLGGSLVDGMIEVSDLGGNLAGTLQGLRLARSQNRFHAVNHAHNHARTDADTLVHDQPIVEVTNRPTKPVPERHGLENGRSTSRMIPI